LGESAESATEAAGLSADSGESSAGASLTPAGVDVSSTGSVRSWRSMPSEPATPAPMPRPATAAAAPTIVQGRVMGMICVSFVVRSDLVGLVK
jgi:hypothetical protein